MDKENIKIGNIWIEDSESIRKRMHVFLQSQ